MGREVAVARQVAAPGGELRARPQDHERGRVSGLLSAGRRHRAARDGLRAAGGAPAHGGSPEIDDLVQQQAGERDAKKREALLHRIQQMTIDRAMFAPIMDLRALMGIGPKMADHTINLVPMTVWPSYEDMKIKSQ